MSKRPNGTGTLHERADGRWSAQLQVGGQRHTVYGRTKAEVRQKLEQLQREAVLAGGLPEQRTLSELIERFLASGEGTWKPRTLSDYQHIAEVVQGELGDLSLRKLTPIRLQSLYGKLKRTPRKALFCHQLLHHALKLAVLWGWIPTNPADRVMRPGYRKVEKPLWQVEQCRRFLDEAKGDSWWPFFAFALQTGCRFGELIALTWSDVDQERRTIRVERSLQCIRRQWIESSPKTKSGRRQVHIGKLGVEALSRQEAVQGEWRRVAGTEWQEAGRIFTNRKGLPLERSTVLGALAILCRRLALPIITTHQLRHLSASLALQAGAPIALVSRQLGHANVSITTSIYSHAISDGRVVAESLERVLTGRSD